MAVKPQEAAVARLAGRQHGNITFDQLRELGLGADAIAHRAGTGRLYRVHHRVYAVGRPPKTALERAAAAVLACGPSAALSFLSALANWDLTKKWPTLFDVSLPGDRRPKGVRTHCYATLAPRDIRTRNGIRTTSPARTLLDCAPLLSDQALARAVNDARLAKIVTPPALQDVIARNPHHRGGKRLAAHADQPQAPTRSTFEDAFLTLCAHHGLPRPDVNVRVAGYEVDALFREQRLIVELDGYRYHSDRRTFERDRRRDADTLAAGFATIRITWERIARDPDGEAARLRRILDQR